MITYLHSQKNIYQPGYHSAVGATLGAFCLGG
jgi:hypothetical protein